MTALCCLLVSETTQLSRGGPKARTFSHLLWLFLHGSIGQKNVFRSSYIRTNDINWLVRWTIPYCLSYCKIAGLWPAIFSATPGNFEIFQNLIFSEKC